MCSSDLGPYRSIDSGASWERPNFPDRDVDIYAMTYHPTRPNVLYAGAAPVALYRSEDGGDSWKKMPAARAPKNCDMDFPVRVIRMAIDPSRPDDIYLALEVDGVIRSTDGGETFTDVSGPLIELAKEPHLKSKIGSSMDSEGMLDSHCIAVSPASPGQPILAVRIGLFRAQDRGASWHDMKVGRFSPLTYARDVCVSPHNPRTLYACLSTAARSNDGTLYRSDDLGETWRRFDHGIKAEGTMTCVTVSRADPKRIYCVSRVGQVFGTEDEGATWITIDRAPARRFPQVYDTFKDQLFTERVPGTSRERVISLSTGNDTFWRVQVGPADGGQLRVTPVGSVTDILKAAWQTSPPKETGDFRAADLVDVRKLTGADTIQLDVRYATTNNFLSTQFYTQARAYLQRPAAEAVVRVHKQLEAFGYGIRIHDGYRPWAVTKAFWDATPVEKHWLVANPASGSKHNRGCAVDLTPYELSTGFVVEMPSTYEIGRAHV